MNSQRKLFCELSPLTYRISELKCRYKRHLQNILGKETFATQKSNTPLPNCVYSHCSIIRRKLKNVDFNLQENKAANLNIAVPLITNILIHPGETFSFWKLVGSCTEKKGYKEGLFLSNGNVKKGIGGGMCQFSNLIHWMVLHTPMEITEYHHHDGVDLFPDYKRRVPFGIGTSITYNYLDYRFKNTTDLTFQLIVSVKEDTLYGELRANQELNCVYHIKEENAFFSKEKDGIYRNNFIYRECYDVKTNQLLSRQLIKKNHAKVLYDTKGLNIINKIA